MAVRKLIHHSLHRRISRSLTARHHYATQSSAVTATSSSSPPSPLPPNAMIYDRLAESVKSKIRRLENPDPRFLRYASPHPTLTDHSNILQFPTTRITTLPNGLRVATESNLAAKSATVGVWIDSGSRFEKEGANGVAKFLEHMILKGKQNKALEEIENIGGQLNGYTSREMTAYFANVMAKDVGKGIEILGNVLQNSDFSEDMIDSEREAIISQREEVDPHSEEAIFDHLHSTAFQYTALGRSSNGLLHNINSIAKANILDYISMNYAAHRMVIAASGAVKHEEVVDQVKKYFTKLSANPAITSQLVENEPAYFTGSEVRVVDDDIPLAKFAIAFSGASWTDPDSIALMVIQNMLGSWNKNQGGGSHMGSELVQKAAINGIAEKITAFNINYKDTGLFGVYAVAEADALDDLSHAMMQAISKLPYRASDADVTRARNQLKSTLLNRTNGMNAVVEDIGHQLLTYGRRIPYAELFARIDAVDSETVKRVANRFIFDKDVAIAGMGPIFKLPDYNWFRRRTYMLRY